MDVKEVKKRVAEIKKVMGDQEAAHSLEDQLYQAVLESIVKDPSNAQELAKEALKTIKLDFERWYA